MVAKICNAICRHLTLTENFNRSSVETKSFQDNINTYVTEVPAMHKTKTTAAMVST